MRRILISFIFIGTFGLYTIYFGRDKNLIPATPIPVASPSGRGIYKDGEYESPRVDAFYGFIKLKVTVKNGQINDVNFIEYPHDRNTSIEVNTYAMPILKTETITSQTAKVDIVSGATDSSMAFREALAETLKQAQI